MKKIKILLMIAFCFCVNLAKADEWRLKAGRAKDIAVGANGAVWSIGDTPTDGSFNIQFWTGSSWQNIDGGGVRIAVDPNGNPWVVNNANQLFRREKNRWIELPGRAKDIGIGANGDVWKINLESPGAIPVFGSTIQRWNGTNWVDIAGLVGADRISVGPNGQPFVVTVSGSIHEKIRAGNWQTYPGQANDISIGANGSIWVIGRIARGGGSYSIHKWNVDTWEEADGGGTQIAVDAEGKPWITNHLNQIYKRTYTTPVYRSVIAISPITHDYPYTGSPSCIAANPSNQNNLLIASGSGGVYETTNALSTTRTWTHNSTLTNPNINDLIFTTGGTAFAAAGETFKNNVSTPQIWQKNSSGVWSLARFVAGTSIPVNKTSCYKIVKADADFYYACGDFGIAIYGTSGTEWKILDFPPNIPVYSIAALKNGTIAAGTPSGIYSFNPYGAAFGSSTPRWSITNATAIFTDATQRYQLNTDFKGSVFLYLNRRISTSIFYSTDCISWLPVLNVPPLHPKGSAAGGFESIYLDSLITGNYSVIVSNRFKFYQANIYGTSPFQGLETYRTGRQELRWTIIDDNTNQTHDDTRHFLKLRGNDGTNKVVITSDGGFHMSNFNFANPNEYNWQTERTSSGLNTLEVYNMAGNNQIINFGTQHNYFGALGASFNLINTTKPGLSLTEGYLMSRTGLGDVDPKAIVFDGGSQSIHIRGKAFETDLLNICGAVRSDWNSPNVGWGVPVWLGNKMYIQDATPPEGSSNIFPWKISFDNGCNWQNLPSCNAVRMSKNCFFSVRNNVEQNLYVSIQNSGINKLARLVNPHIIAKASWATPYPAMSNLEGGIGLIGADFLYNPVFCVNPANPDNLFALENNTGKLKVSNDGGNNWTESMSFTRALTVTNPSNFKGSKNTFSIKSMSFSPFDSNLILIGTVSEGLYKSSDGGNTWQRIQSPGLFNITDFHWRSPNSIIISTYGHGLFSMSM